MKRSLLVALAFLVAGAATLSASSLHFALSKSMPEAESTVAPPDELRLWFSQVPQENSVSVRLVDGSGELVHTGDPTPDASDGKVIAVSIDHALAPGSYTVAWRGIGDDGHVVRGDFPFSVATR